MFYVRIGLNLFVDNMETIWFNVCMLPSILWSLEAWTAWLEDAYAACAILRVNSGSCAKTVPSLKG